MKSDNYPVNQTRETDKASLFARLQQGDRAARTEIFASCQPMVNKIAQRYRHQSHLTFNDLLAEGYVGLLLAIEKFDIEKAQKTGTKFSSYAYWWIRRYISRAVLRAQSLLSIPESVTELVSRRSHYILEASKRLGRMPTEEEIKNDLLLTAGQSHRLKHRYLLREISLDSQLEDEDGSRNLSDVISRVSRGSIEKHLQEEMLLRKILAPLSEVEKEVLKRRFGLDGYRPSTYEEIGRSLKTKKGKTVSRQRVHQIIQTALTKARKTAQAMQK